MWNVAEHANYALAENGKRRLFHARFGAVTLLPDLIAGPAAATRFVSAQTECYFWRTEIWCEGAALIDHDRRSLLLYTWHVDDLADQLAALAVLERTWPGWEVHWAYNGVAEVVAASGQDPALVRDTSEYVGILDPFEDAEFDEVCVVSVRDVDGVRAYAMASIDASPVLIDRGVGLLDLLPAEALRTSFARTPNLGLHLDVRNRTAGVWTGMALCGEVERAVEGWPGWRWKLWDNRHEEQLRRADGAVSWPAPDIAAALDALAAKVDSHPLSDADHARVRAAIAEVRALH